MKLFTSVVVAAAAMTLAASAQQKPQPGKVESVLMLDGGKSESVYIMGATEKTLDVVKNRLATESVKRSRKGVNSIFMKDPKAYLAVMALYENRKYDAAQKSFVRLKELYKGVQILPDNHATRSGFYELECMRRQLKLAGLLKALEDFDAKPLTRPAMRQQVEVYRFWKLAHKKKWARLDDLAVEWKEKSLPVSLRAQVSYCHALALEALDRPVEALNMFSKAMTADFAKSEEIARNSVYGSLRIYAALPEVKTAIDKWGLKDEEDKDSKGYKLLLEANALARLYVNIGLGAGVDLPAEHAAFLDYTPKEDK